MFYLSVVVPPSPQVPSEKGEKSAGAPQATRKPRKRSKICPNHVHAVNHDSSIGLIGDGSSPASECLPRRHHHLSRLLHHPRQSTHHRINSLYHPTCLLPHHNTYINSRRSTSLPNTFQKRVRLYSHSCAPRIESGSRRDGGCTSSS
jgi:hypothetical protein